MDTYLNLKAFLAAIEAGSFSGAARNQGLATPVLTKRVNQLEHQLGKRLFHRSTRSLKLTETGRSYIAQCRAIVSQIDDLMANPRAKQELEDFIRVRAPVTMARMFLAPMISDFAATHPKVRVDLVISERPLVSEEPGFDISIGARPVTLGSITDVTLGRLNRIACAAPAYLEKFGTPSKPRDLLKHSCLCFTPTSTIWVFKTDAAPIEFEIVPKLSSNDGQLIADAAVAGMGITILSEYIVADKIRRGNLVPLLQDFPQPELWLKATLPRKRIASPAVNELIDHLKAGLGSTGILNMI